MAILPDNKKTTEYLIESKMYGGNKPRTYLGMSGIGNLCLRAQWYSWRWATRKEIPARIQRIFNRGHSEEYSVICDLKSIGVEVFRRESKNKIEINGAIGEAQEELVGFHQHCKGHPDGRTLGIIEAPKAEHLLEIKTMNDKYFTMLITDGLQKAFPAYHCQMIKYMGKMKLKRGIFVATNKNNQARKYIRVKFDEELFINLEEREENIILSEHPPRRKYHASHYKCNWCSHNNICHYGENPLMNCRTCEHADVMPKGKWYCSIKKRTLSSRKQFRGCELHKRLF